MLPIRGALPQTKLVGAVLSVRGGINAAPKVRWAQNLALGAGLVACGGVKAAPKGFAPRDRREGANQEVRCGWENRAAREARYSPRRARRLSRAS